MKRPEVDIFIYMFAAIIWLLLLRYLLFIFKWELLTIRKRQNASGFKTINCKQSFHNLTEGGKKKKRRVSTTRAGAFSYLFLYLRERAFQKSISSSFEENFGVISISMANKSGEEGIRKQVIIMSQRTSDSHSSN